jgi:hypothetical protein
VNWWLVGFGVVLAWIGGSLIAQGDNSLTRWMGLFLAVNAGMMIALGLNIPAQVGWIKPDPKACAQYVLLEGTWKCVPWTEAG